MVFYIIAVCFGVVLMNYLILHMIEKREAARAENTPRKPLSRREIGTRFFSYAVVAVSCGYPFVLFLFMPFLGLHTFFAGFVFFIPLLILAGLFSVSCSWIWFPPKEVWRRDLVTVAFGSFAAFAGNACLKMWETNEYYPQQSGLWVFFFFLGVGGCAVMAWCYSVLRREPCSTPKKQN